MGVRDEVVDPVISEYSKLAKREYKTRHHWMIRGIHWQSCMRLKFNDITKWYIPKPESTLENEMYKILRKTARSCVN